jgi:stearoyl-CoA desaturase (delta-9 desaturase)
MTYISVFYHRAFTHEAIRIHPRLRRFIVVSGNWITGIDIKAWACMHRMHHMYSDTMQDPHSPKRWGLFGTMLGQLQSYKATIRGLIRGKPEYVNIVKDLDFEISSLNRKQLWALPYAIHAGVWLACGILLNSWLLGFAYFAGMMSHPVQGWLVNSFGHAHGYRNFKTSDDSRNNTLVAWTCFGEGYQNNHHRFPKSAKFSMRWFEFDFGWTVAQILASLSIVEILQVASGNEARQAHESPDVAVVANY